MSEDAVMKKIVVVGGGLSGLSAASAILDAAGSAGLKVGITLLEKDSWLGGKIRSVRKEGFLCETGPNGFLDNKPATLLLAARLAMKDRLLKSDDKAKKRFIFSGGRLQRLPEDPVSFVSSDLLSIRGRLRIAAEFLLPQGPAGVDESVASFVRRRLGQEALDKLIDPMSAGVYAGDPNVMSLESSFPKVAMIERQFGGLLKGMMAMQKMAKARGQEAAMSAGPGGSLWSFRDGMGELIDKLAEGLPDVRTGVSAAKLVREGDGWSVETDAGETLKADAVVLCVPAYSGGKLLREHCPAASEHMYNIPYVPTAVACVGFDREKIAMPLDGFGFLIPTVEKRRILGALWSSSIFAHRAPDGKVLFTLIIGGARNPEFVSLGDEALSALCREELGATMGINEKPVFESIVRWERAIPQYVVGHGERVRAIEAEIAGLGGIFLGGNAYYGIGINDCTERASVLGQKVVGALKGESVGK